MLSSAFSYSVGVPEEVSYAAEYPARTFPCQTLRRCPCEQLRMTRGRCGSLFHFRMTFAFTTPRRFNRRTRSQYMSTTPTAPQTAVSTWAIDPAHSMAELKVKHMMISNVKGQFSGVSGTLERHEGDVTKSKVEVTIDAASVNTRDAQRDAHLKSPDFFEVEKFPTLSFKSTRIIPKNQDEHAVEGELTIHGAPQTVRFAV